MAYSIQITRAAAKRLADLERRDCERIRDRIDELGEDPYRIGTSKLKGSSNDYRKYRVGDYRIIYQVEQDKLVVLIIKIGHRREVYKEP